MIEYSYIRAVSSAYTLQSPSIMRYVRRWLCGTVINPFGGSTRLPFNEVSNDIDPAMSTDYHMDVIDFLRLPIGCFDSALLDPPWSIDTMNQHYGGRIVKSFEIVKDELLRRLTDEAVVVTICYNSWGMGRKRGFKILARAIVNFGPAARDALITVERRVILPLVPL